MAKGTASLEGQLLIAAAINELGEDITKVSGFTKTAQESAETAVEKAEDSTRILNAIRSEYGYPFTAATASAMTDTAKIYVYVGSEAGYIYGNWYYHNGTAWVSGGTFASLVEVDPTLSITGAAAHVSFDYTVGVYPLPCFH